MSLTPVMEALHHRALDVSSRHRELEWEIVQVLMAVGRAGLHRQLGKSSLFKYAVELLGFSESSAYQFITVARKCEEVSALASALAAGVLTVPKAARIVAALEPENAEELIAFAVEHSYREIDFEVARRNPRARRPDRVRPISEDQVEITKTVSRRVFELLMRAEAVSGTQGGDTLEEVLEFYLDRKDPVRKAERAAAGEKLRAHRVPKERKKKEREPLTAEVKHAVFLRDRGRCTHKDASGKVCGADRWVEVHHIVPLHRGGTNEISNLTTLCWFHHDLMHQMELPFDGPATHVRSSVAAYWSPVKNH